jgi:hypothetical protein
MPQTRPNGVVTPINSDAYNLTADLSTMGDSANVIVPVATQAVRDALPTHVGLTVSRNDLPGNPLQTWNGSAWSTQQVPKVWATGARVGTSTGLLTNLQSGTLVPIIQANSDVVTTNSTGDFIIVFPQAFPNGLIAVIPSNGDNSATGRGYTVTQGPAAATLSQFFGSITQAGTAYTSKSARVDWIAVG